MGRLFVYSALYGDYDTAKPIDVGDVPAYLFTDQAGIDAPGWEVVHRPHRVTTRNGPAELLAPMLAHKWWKTHPIEAIEHATGCIWALGAVTSIWIDASIVLEPGFIDKALSALGGDDWAMVPHPWRTCIYTEADYSASLPRYAGLADRIRAQAEFYRTIVGHPANAGLVATGLIVRRHTAPVILLGEQWWSDILHWTHQDQISLPVLLRLAGEWGDRLRWNTNIGWLGGWQLWPHLK